MKSAHPLLFVAFVVLSLFVFLGARTKSQSKEAVFLLPSTFISSQNTDGIGTKSILGPETPELVLVQKDGVRASTPPITVTPRVLGALIGQIDAEIKPEVLRYEVELNDTLASVAKKFDISINTILWTNDLQTTSILKPGQELIILPVSGALHIVRAHDTLSEIASWYKASIDEIVEFNSLAFEEAIFTGDILIIPNGTMPKVLAQGRLTPVPNSYFIYPIPSPHRLTQGLHPFNAVDLSNGICGDPVYTAAGGQVQRTGHASVGGNYVRLLHPNGVVTYYGHLSAFIVQVGSKVFQGQIIGYVGHTGLTIPRGSAGCHLHFEVRGAANPFVSLR